jgi:hypothetical protein
MSESITLSARRVQARLTRGHVVGLFDKLYALRYPRLYRDAAWDRFGADWRRDAPGASMVFPPVDVSKSGLAAELRPDFVHVAKAVGQYSAQAAVARPSALKVFARHRLPPASEERQQWRDEERRMCKLGELLPDDDTVEAMFVAWHDRGRSRCEPLERFIGRSLTRNRGDDYHWRILHGVIPELPEEL